MAAEPTVPHANANDSRWKLLVSKPVLGSERSSHPLGPSKNIPIFHTHLRAEAGGQHHNGRVYTNQMLGAVRIGEGREKSAV